MINKEDKQLFEKIKRGEVPFVKMVVMPVVRHETFNEYGECTSSKAVHLDTILIDSLTDLVDRLYLNQMLYIYPLNDDTPYHRTESINICNPNNFEVTKKVKHIVRIAKANIGSVEADREYKKLEKPKTTDRKLLLLTLK